MTMTTPTTDDRPDFLRTVLIVDCLTCLAMGLFLTLGAALVANLTRIPSSLLSAAGASLFPSAVLMAAVAARSSARPAGAWLVILGNIAWVLGSLWLLLSGAIAPNALGQLFIAGQAAVVTVLAGLEVCGIRSVPPPQ